MGLVYDPNKSFGIPNTKNQLRKLIQANKDVDDSPKEEANEPRKIHVVKRLEEIAKAPRVSGFRLPKSQVEWITYLMDKYGANFKAMARDKRNYNQETWKQLRAKIKTFKSIREQYTKYLGSKMICVSRPSGTNSTVDVSEDDSDWKQYHIEFNNIKYLW